MGGRRVVLVHANKKGVGEGGGRGKGCGLGTGRQLPRNCSQFLIAKLESESHAKGSHEYTITGDVCTCVGW